MVSAGGTAFIRRLLKASSQLKPHWSKRKRAWNKGYHNFQYL